MARSPRRSTVRSVAMPAEHGGWGLTLEPGILGVLLAPSVAGLLLGAAALLAFLVRTPLRLVLIGRNHAAARPQTRIGRERMQLAGRVAALELVGLVGAVLLAGVFATDALWWLPGVVAAPMFLVALWFDARSRSRHLVPELVGSIAVASVAAMGALAGGAAWPLAIGAWLILSARVLSSIPHVRAQIRRIHGRPVDGVTTLAGDLAAIAVATIAVLMDSSLIGGAIAIVLLVVIQRITLARPPRPAKVLGVRQMLLGFAVVGATATGSWWL